MSGGEMNESDWASFDESTKDNQKNSLPYEEGQYRPSYKEGSRKYTNKFMLAVGATINPDNSESCNADDSTSLEPELEYDDGMFSPNNPDGLRRYSIKFLKAVGRLSRMRPDARQLRIEPYSQEKLPYESGQYSPTNPEGDKKYSSKFLKAVGEMLMPDEDAFDIAPLLSERTIFPWDLHVKRVQRDRERRCITINEPAKPADDTWT